jgi:hypothetical protein
MPYFDAREGAWGMCHAVLVVLEELAGVAGEQGAGAWPARFCFSRRDLSVQCPPRLFFFTFTLFPLRRPATGIVITDVVPPSDLFEVAGEPTAKVER